jgi:micrococcal nuclease
MKRKLTPAVAILMVLSAYFYYNYFFTGSHTPGLAVSEPPPGITAVAVEGLKPGRYIRAAVTRLTDGDTFDVSYKGKTYKVRLLDVDTPESVKSGVQVQAYGKEASDFTRKQVLNKKVRLVFEKGLRDKYGRLLAHVFLEDESYLNGLLVRNGYARVELVKPNTAYADYFYSLQEQAIRDKAGVWGLPEKQQPFVKNTKGEYVPRYWK